MLVEGIGSVTFLNGVLRVQLITTNASGQPKEACELEIPGNRVNDVINGLAVATKEITNKLDEANNQAEVASDNDSSESNGKSSGSKKTTGKKKKNK